MRPTSLLFCFFAAALALPRVALAAEPTPPAPPPEAGWAMPPALPPPVGWGLHSGDTVGEGNTLLYAEVGWPDVSLGFQRGIASNVDVGFRASFLYGIDYVVPKQRANGTTNVAPGLGLSVPLRFTLLRSDHMSVLFHVDPGFKLDGFSPKIFAGPQMPLGLDLGMHLSRRSTLTLGVDMPLSVRVTPDATAFIPLLMGLTFESRFSERFGMSFNVRSGIVHGINKTGGDTNLGLIGQVGFFGRT